MILENQTVKSLLTVVGLIVSASSQAALIERGSDMVYDDVLDITWLKDANYAKTSGYDSDGKMDWEAANTWASTLTVGGYTDWRLPTIAPITGNSFSYFLTYNNTSDVGFNTSEPNSEMGYMFYQNLGNNGRYNTAGDPIPCLVNINNCLQNTGTFENLEPWPYWTSVNNEPNPRFAWKFGTSSGMQGRINKFNKYYAWAVHPGDIVGSISPVPEPSAIALMLGGLGLVGFMAARRRKALL